MKEKKKGEINDNDFEKENYHELFKEEKDSLMWSEEDYTAMQNLTGFDEESVSKDQRRGFDVLVLVIVCIICLILGVVIGYNVQPTKQINTNPKEDSEIADLPQAFYTRLNNSNELYLYELSNIGEEISILDLSNSYYKYEYIDTYLYLLIEKNDSLKFYRYKFTKQGYRRDIVKEFDEEYESFYFEDEYVILSNKETVNIYDLGGVLIKSLDLKNVEVLGYDRSYLIYSEGQKLNVISLKIDYQKTISNNMSTFLSFDGENLYFIENQKIYRASILDFEPKEILEVEDNKVFMRVNDYYVFSDGKAMYVLEDEFKKVKEFDQSISEISYVDRDNLIIILENYDTYECALSKNRYYLFNINSKSIISREINGCLGTMTLNGYEKIK